MTITRKNGSHGLSAMSAYAPQVLSAPLSCRCPQALACKSTGQMLRSRTSIAKNTRCSCKVLPPASVPQSREPPCTSFLNGSSPSSAKTSKPCGGALQGREGRGRQEAEPADLASGLFGVGQTRIRAKRQRTQPAKFAGSALRRRAARQAETLARGSEGCECASTQRLSLPGMRTIAEALIARSGRRASGSTT